MVLTQGEKMVWAMAFIDVYNRHVEGSVLRLSLEGSAVSAAHKAVVTLRKYRDKCGELLNDEAKQMLQSMLGEE